ncbi:MAG TPA: hypothetical protein V6D08_15920 [Candidatus Obscuribacterales bacterium]
MDWNFSPTDIAYCVATAVVVILAAKALKRFRDKVEEKRQRKASKETGA